MTLTQTLITRAKKHGLDVISVGDHVEVRKGDEVLAFHSNPTKCLELALSRVLKTIGSRIDIGTSELPELPEREPVIEQAETDNGWVSPEKVDELPEQEPPLKGSIIKPQYKTRYRQTGSCGDDLSDELRAYIELKKDGRMSIDLNKLREVAQTNGVWHERYAALNPGQQRMTVGNRLRAKWRAGDKVDIGGVMLQQME